MYCLIGIDAQPDRIKAVLFDLRGNLIHQTVVDNNRIGEGKTYEVDMLQVWDNTVMAVKSLMRSAAILPEEVAAIGVTGSEGGFWAIDENGNPVMNAIASEDGRGEEEVWEINIKTPGIGKLVHRNLGRPVDSGSTLILSRWLRKNEPKAYGAAKTIFFEKDWIRYKMTDRIATDYSDGSSAFFRFANNGIPTQLMTVLGLNDLVDKIPVALSGDALGGQLSEHAANLMGLTPGIPVGTGCVQKVASCIGVGSYEKNHVIIFLDDQINICLGRDKSSCDPGRTGRYFLPHAKKDAALEILFAEHGLSNILWTDRALMAEKNPQKSREKGTLIFNEQNVGNSETVSPFVSRIMAVPQGAEGVIYYPFSKKKNGNEFSAGNFFGVKPNTTIEMMVRAVYESVGYAIKTCFEIGGNIEKILLIGNDFSREPFLPQFISDIIGKDIMVSEGSTFAAKGAAMLAGIAAGYYEHIQDAVFQCCSDCKKIQGNPSSIYEDNYQIYSELRRACAPLWQLDRKIWQKDN